jgi:hypothetical protein
VAASNRTSKPTRSWKNSMSRRTVFSATSNRAAMLPAVCRPVANSRTSSVRRISGNGPRFSCGAA